MAPLVLQLTAEMIDLEEHASSQQKEGGGLNHVPTIESEKFSVVGFSKYYLLDPDPPTT
jgi:ATP-dependent DNA helicase RecQ